MVSSTLLGRPETYDDSAMAAMLLQSGRGAPKWPKAAPKVRMRKYNPFFIFLLSEESELAMDLGLKVFKEEVNCNYQPKEREERIQKGPSGLHRVQIGGDAFAVNFVAFIFGH